MKYLIVGNIEFIFHDDGTFGINNIDNCDFFDLNLEQTEALKKFLDESVLFPVEK